MKEMRLSECETEGEIPAWTDFLEGEGLRAKEMERDKTLDRATRGEADIFFVLFSPRGFPRVFLMYRSKSGGGPHPNRGGRSAVNFHKQENLSNLEWNRAPSSTGPAVKW